MNMLWLLLSGLVTLALFHAIHSYSDIYPTSKVVYVWSREWSKDRKYHTNIDLYMDAWLAVNRIYQYAQIIQQDELELQIEDEALRDMVCEHIILTSLLSKPRITCTTSSILEKCHKIDMSSSEFIRTILRRNLELSAIKPSSTLSSTNKQSSRSVSMTGTKVGNKLNDQKDITICHSDQYRIPTHYLNQYSQSTTSLQLIPELLKDHLGSFNSNAAVDNSKSSIIPTIHLYFRLQTKAFTEFHSALLKYIVHTINKKFGKHSKIYLTTDSYDLFAKCQENFEANRLVFHDFIRADSVDSSISRLKHMIQADFFVTVNDDLISNFIEASRKKLQKNYCLSRFLLQNFDKSKVRNSKDTLDRSMKEEGEKQSDDEFYPAWCSVEFKVSEFHVGEYYLRINREEYLVIPDSLISAVDLLLDQSQLQTFSHQYRESTYFALFKSQKGSFAKYTSVDPTEEGGWYSFFFRTLIRMELKPRFRIFMLFAACGLCCLIITMIFIPIYNFLFQPKLMLKKFRRL